MPQSRFHLPTSMSIRYEQQHAVFDPTSLANPANYGKAFRIDDDGNLELIEANTANSWVRLDGDEKIPINHLPADVLIYRGLYNITTNTPSISDLTGVSGDVYLCSVAGSRDFGSGSITVGAGDWLIHNGTKFERSIHIGYNKSEQDNRFLRKDTNDTLDGNLTVTGNTSINGTLTITGNVNTQSMTFNNHTLGNDRVLAIFNNNLVSYLTTSNATANSVMWRNAQGNTFVNTLNAQGLELPNIANGRVLHTIDGSGTIGSTEMTDQNVTQTIVRRSINGRINVGSLVVEQSGIQCQGGHIDIHGANRLRLGIGISKGNDSDGTIIYGGTDGLSNTLDIIGGKASGGNTDRNTRIWGNLRVDESLNPSHDLRIFNDSAWNRRLDFGHPLDGGQRAYIQPYRNSNGTLNWLQINGCGNDNNAQHQQWVNINANLRIANSITSCPTANITTLNATNVNSTGLVSANIVSATGVDVLGGFSCNSLITTSINGFNLELEYGLVRRYTHQFAGDGTQQTITITGDTMGELPISFYCVNISNDTTVINDVAIQPIGRDVLFTRTWNNGQVFQLVATFIRTL